MSNVNFQPATDEDIWHALQFIPATERETWVTVGIAIKSTLGNDGFSMWNTWSQSAESYQEKSAKDVWKSIKAGAPGIGLLFHIAKQHGWRRERTPEVTKPLPSPKTPPTESKADTASYALRLWLAAEFTSQAVAGHPYAKSKGITWAAGTARGKASGKIIGQQADCIIVPIRDIETNKVLSVQCINPGGNKQTFGPVKGNALLLGNTLDKRIPWYVCEGWASAVSMVFHHQKGNGVCAASFGKSNQDAVAQRIAEIHDPNEIIILREVD